MIQAKRRLFVWKLINWEIQCKLEIDNWKLHSERAGCITTAVCALGVGTIRVQFPAARLRYAEVLTKAIIDTPKF